MTEPRNNLNRIDAPGIYQITAEHYHADPCPTPSLSASVATILCQQSPRHAWAAHPRFNPDAMPENKAIYDVGTAVHALLLDDEHNIAKIELVSGFDDWKKKAAQEARDEAYLAGKVPLLDKDCERVNAIVEAARAQLAVHEVADDFRTGRCEQTLIWQRDGVWCRMRADWIPGNGAEIIYDVKTTAGSAHPDLWSRARMFEGPDIQSSHYKDGARAVLGWKRPRFRNVVIEQKPPHALSVLELDPAAINLADRKWKPAVRTWGRCLAEDRWPGYPSRVCHVEAPPWIEARQMEREIRTEANPDLLRQAMDWQAPIRGAAE